MGVYPPARDWKRGAISSKSFLTVGASGIVFRTRRRAWRPPLLPRVTIFSMSGRRSFAFGSVVWMRSWVMRDESWFRNNALRCAVVRPSFRPARLCCMEPSAPRAGRGLELHAEGEALVEIGRAEERRVGKEGRSRG